MIHNISWRNKLTQLMSTTCQLSVLQWFLVLLFSVVIFISLGLVDRPSTVFLLTIGPAENSNGPVKVVFYGTRYNEYLASGSLRIPGSGWKIEILSDATIVTSTQDASPLVFHSEGDPLVFGLLRYTNAGIARLIDGDNVVQLINLHSNSESISTLTIGGNASNVQPTNGVKYLSTFGLAGVFASILGILTLTALKQSRNCKSKSNEIIVVGWQETFYFALPLLASTTFVLLAFWPGNVTHDGSLQWHQALARGILDPNLGITATLFLRLFTHLSTCPALVVVFQSALSATGLALILRELRYKGVPRWTAQICAVALAFTPQYAIFFTNLGKDALCAVGIIFLVWSLLLVSRCITAGRLNYFYFVPFIAGAAFSGVMRTNVMPSAILAVSVLVAVLIFYGWRTEAFTVGTVFLMLIIFVPKIALSLCDELSSTQTLQTPQTPQTKHLVKRNDPLPLGYFANWYIYHLFSAAVHSGTPLDAQDEELFYRIAPRNAWAKYDSYMTDTTFIAISNEKLLPQQEYIRFLKEHQLDLANAVLRIIKKNPSILIDRQIGISKMLWYIGYGQRPFQTTGTLGYDDVTNEFLEIAGENRTLLPAKIRVAMQKYLSWTESYKVFWIFWKPALIFYLGLFIVSLRLTMKRDIGLLFVLSVPLSLTFVLALAIPFPAYRYQYISVLLMSLFCTLVFSTEKTKAVLSEHTVPLTGSSPLPQILP